MLLIQGPTTWKQRRRPTSPLSPSLRTLKKILDYEDLLQKDIVEISDEDETPMVSEDFLNILR
jgi:hypothetical protein